MLVRKKQQSSSSSNSDIFKFVTADQIKPHALRWLWPHRIPVGLVTVVAGAPKSGKSLLCCKLAATVSRGGEFAPGEGSANRGHVVLLNGEDPPEIIRDWLAFARADMGRVHVATAPQTLLRDDLIPALEEKIKDLPYLRMLIIDPLTGIVSFDRNSAGQVRKVLSDLGDFAARRRIAVVVVLHLNKSGNGAAASRISGSFEFTGASRSGYVVVKDGDRYLLLPLPNNVGLREEGLAFTIRVRPRMLGGVCVAWLGAVAKSADDALYSTEEASGTLKQEGVQLLSELLAKGHRPVAEIRLECKEAGLTPKSVRAARVHLGITIEKGGVFKRGHRWYWRLPAASCPERQETASR
jgi:putative DNA primase/helicase